MDFMHAAQLGLLAVLVVLGVGVLFCRPISRIPPPPPGYYERRKTPRPPRRTPGTDANTPYWKIQEIAEKNKK